ncbi:MAG: hypothetical protein WB359_25095 [Bryobacteraceae bacterium]
MTWLVVFVSLMAAVFRKNARKAGMLPSAAKLGLYPQTYAWGGERSEQEFLPCCILDVLVAVTLHVDIHPPDGLFAYILYHPLEGVFQILHSVIS